MNPAGKRTPKVKEFVHAPFVKCPDCGAENMFGVLMIYSLSMRTSLHAFRPSNLAGLR
jgi:hypothetical protein